MKQVRLSQGKRPSNRGCYTIEDNFKSGVVLLERGCVRYSGEVDGHHIIYFNGSKPHIRNRVEILGVLHDPDEVPNKLYEHAVKYAKDLAEINNAEFIDMTQGHRQESKLVKSISSQ